MIKVFILSLAMLLGCATSGVSSLKRTRAQRETREQIAISMLFVLAFVTIAAAIHQPKKEAKDD